MKAHELKVGMTIRIYGDEIFRVESVRKRGRDMIEIEGYDKSYGGRRSHVFNHAMTVKMA